MSNVRNVAPPGPDNEATTFCGVKGEPIKQDRELTVFVDIEARYVVPRLINISPSYIQL